MCSHKPTSAHISIQCTKYPSCNLPKLNSLFSVFLVSLVLLRFFFSFFLLFLTYNLSITISFLFPPLLLLVFTFLHLHRFSFSSRLSIFHFFMSAYFLFSSFFFSFIPNLSLLALFDSLCPIFFSHLFF